MTETDVAEFIGFMITAYVGGWVSGYLIYVFKRITDYL